MGSEESARLRSETIARQGGGWQACTIRQCMVGQIVDMPRICFSVQQGASMQARTCLKNLSSEPWVHSPDIWRHISSNMHLVLSEDLFKTGDSHIETWLQQAVLVVVSCCSAYHKVPSRKDAEQTIFRVASAQPQLMGSLWADRG